MSMSTKIRTARTALANYRTERIAHRRLAAELAEYQTPAERTELDEVLARHTTEDTREVRAILARHGLVQSMSRKGNCLDNAPMESFFGTLKNELVHRTSFPTREAARRAIFEYVEAFYNRRRRHSGLGFLTPAQAYEQMARAA